MMNFSRLREKYKQRMRDLKTTNALIRDLGSEFLEIGDPSVNWYSCNEKILESVERKMFEDRQLKAKLSEEVEELKNQILSLQEEIRCKDTEIVDGRTEIDRLTKTNTQLKDRISRLREKKVGSQKNENTNSFNHQ